MGRPKNLSVDTSRPQRGGGASPPLSPSKQLINQLSNSLAQDTTASETTRRWRERKVTRAAATEREREARALSCGADGALLAKVPGGRQGQGKRAGGPTLGWGLEALSEDPAAAKVGFAYELNQTSIDSWLHGPASPKSPYFKGGIGRDNHAADHAQRAARAAAWREGRAEAERRRKFEAGNDEALQAAMEGGGGSPSGGADEELAREPDGIQAMTSRQNWCRGTTIGRAKRKTSFSGRDPNLPADLVYPNAHKPSSFEVLVATSPRKYSPALRSRVARGSERCVCCCCCCRYGSLSSLVLLYIAIARCSPSRLQFIPPLC